MNSASVSIYLLSMSMNIVPQNNFKSKMSNCNGDDLLKVFAELNVDLRKLNPNVIKAWFDTDCKNTKNLLNFLCKSLSDVNYVSPLEKTEFDELPEQLDEQNCLNELSELDSSYIDILDLDQNLSEIALIEDEIRFLEEDSKRADQLIKVFETLDNDLSTKLTIETKKDIQSSVECRNSQEECEELCNTLDGTVKKIHARFLKYDPEQQFVNFVDIKKYEENMEYFNSLLMPLMEVDKSCLEISDDIFSDSLETCKKRLIQSHQVYFVNKIEIETYKEVEHFLDQICKNGNSLNTSFLNDKTSNDAKEIYKSRLYDVLDNIVLKITDRYLKQTRIRYVQSELEDYQKKYLNISNILECVVKLLSFITLTNCLQCGDKKDIEYINNLYQKTLRYGNEDLLKCQQRTSHMRDITDCYNSSDTSKTLLTTFIAKILNSDDYTLKETYKCFEKFKAEINALESQIFCTNINDEINRIKNVNEDIKVLEEFLKSGPTKQIILVPMELKNVWLEIEEHIKKESSGIQNAVQIPQRTRKKLTKAQITMKQLWMYFLTNATKIESLIKQAEEDFKKRTAQYF